MTSWDDRFNFTNGPVRIIQSSDSQPVAKRCSPYLGKRKPDPGCLSGREKHHWKGHGKERHMNRPRRRCKFCGRVEIIEPMQSQAVAIVRAR